MKALHYLFEPIMYAIATFTSSITILWGGTKALLGQAPIPDPATASAWSFYGVLLVAIVVLFGCLVAGLKWFAGYWMAKQEAMQKLAVDAIADQANATREYARSNRDLASAIEKNTEVVDRQNEFFDQVNRDMIKQKLMTP